MKRSCLQLLALGLLLVALLAVPVLAAGDSEQQQQEEEPAALLMAWKTTETDTPNFEVPVYSVGANITVTVKLFNQGKGSAYEVSVQDLWEPEGFDLLQGDMSASFEEIPAGETAELSFVVAPKFGGFYNSHPARVVYSAVKDGQQVEAFSTSKGQMAILGSQQYRQIATNYTLHYLIFMMLLGAGVVLPAFQYYKLRKSLAEGPAKTSKAGKSKSK